MALEIAGRSRSPDGLRFQVWSSERLMQTVSVKHLRDEPLRSLWYLHIQPPLFDAYRAVLARFYSSLEAGALVDAVDRWIYVAWAAAFAATAALVFLSCAALTSGPKSEPSSGSPTRNAFAAAT